jgi:hypothetical protein
MSWWRPQPPEPFAERVTKNLALRADAPVTGAARTCLQALQAIEPQASSAAADIATEAFRQLFNQLPAHMRTQAPASGKHMSVPLYELCPDCGKAVRELTAPFCGKEMRNAQQFYPLRKTLVENEARASGVNRFDVKAKSKIVAVDKYDAPPEELLRLYLSGTPFYDFFRARVPFVIPRHIWSSHAVVIAPPNFGKSQLLGSILANALNDPDPIALILLDPHGDLFEEAKERVPPERLVVIDPDTNPPDLNIMDFGGSNEHDAFEAFKFLLSSLAGGLSEKQETSAIALFELLKNIDGANLVTLHEVITEKPKKGQPSKFASAIERLPDVHRDFFNNLFFTGNYQETRDALQWKLLAALGRPAFRKMFSASRNSIDMDAFIRKRMVVVVKGGEGALGKEGMRIFLLYLVAQFYAAGKRRDAVPKEKRHLAMMLVDEASHVLQSPIIADILVELRKYQCSFVAATQVWSQVGEKVRPAVLGATAIKMVGAVQHDDASVLARECFTTVEFIRNMQAVERSHADWTVYISQTHADPSRPPPPKKALRVRCPYGILHALPKQATRAQELDVLLKHELGHPSRPETSATPAKKSEAQPEAADDGPAVRPGKDWSPE